MPNPNVSKSAEFTAWMVQALNNWPGPKDQKRKVVELLYDAYRQGRIHGMEAMINPMRQCVQNFDNMAANAGAYKARRAEDIVRFMEGSSNADSDT